jgi:hypothetical protein
MEDKTMIHILISTHNGDLDFSLHNSSEEAFAQAQREITEISGGEINGQAFANTLELGRAIAESAIAFSFTISPAFHSADVLLSEATGHAVHAETAVISSIGNPLVSELHV